MSIRNYLDLMASNRFRTAELARRLASALSWRRMWAMENCRERASFWQTQLREYRRGLRQAYSPFICLTTTSESEKTCRALAFNSKAYCKASRKIGKHTSELQSPVHLVCRLLLEKKKNRYKQRHN